jgi:hypothetical protein
MKYAWHILRHNLLKNCHLLRMLPYSKELTEN